MSADAKIIVWYLPSHFKAADLHELCVGVPGFTGFVNVVADTVTGACKGYGFCYFMSDLEAKNACVALTGLLCGSKTILAKIAVPSYLVDEHSKVFIHGIPYYWTEDNLKNRSSTYGEILHCRIVSTLVQHMKVGFVRFRRDEDAQAAVDGHVNMPHNMTVVLAET